MAEQAEPDLLAEALTWVEDMEPDGDKEGGQTGWCRTGEFCVPTPAPGYPDTVEYIDPVKVADFVLWARDEIGRLRAARRTDVEHLISSSITNVAETSDRTSPDDRRPHGRDARKHLPLDRGDLRWRRK